MLPALRPKTPCRLGPTMLRPPASVVWQILQRLKIAWPAALSAACAEAGARAQKRASVAASRSIQFPRRLAVPTGDFAALLGCPQPVRGGERSFSGRAGDRGWRDFR